MEFLLSNFSKSSYHGFIILWFILNVLIALGNWTGKIRFGLGMGDLIYMCIIGLAILIVAIYYYRDLRISDNIEVLSKSNLLMMGFCLIFLIFIILKITYWRGSESRWDGRIFF